MKILMLASGMPSRVGTGASVRSYHFAKALAAYGDLYLAVISPESGAAVPEELDSACKRVMVPPSQPIRKKKNLSRVAAWKTATRRILMPWRNNWFDLLSYAAGCGVGLYGDTRASDVSNRSLAFRILVRLVGWQVDLAARYFTPLSLMALDQWGNFENLLPEIRSDSEVTGFDLIWFESGPLFPIAAEIAGFSKRRPLMVCNAHNIESNLAFRVQDLIRNTAMSTWLRNQPAILERTEAKAFDACDLVIVCSEEDLRLGRVLAPRGVFRVVGNGVDTGYFKPDGRQQPDAVPTLLFTGTMSYAPNIDAVRYFLEAIFPRIHAQIPECRLVVAGREASAALLPGNSQQDHVEWVCSPDDMRPLFERAWVAIVPLRAGGGTRLKIPEAMAMECPVVSTSIGAEGVPYVDGRHLLLADHPEEFADAVLRLLKEEKLRDSIKAEAGEFIRTHYDWSMLCGAAMSLLGDLPQVRMCRQVETEPAHAD
jgi:glycosyltransferase involved in cell wall biosynthesis